MRDSIRKIFVLGVFFTAVASVWTLGAVKADLDGPSGTGMQVDPAIVRAALLADPAEQIGEAQTNATDATGQTYPLAS